MSTLKDRIGSGRMALRRPATQRHRLGFVMAGLGGAALAGVLYVLAAPEKQADLDTPAPVAAAQEAAPPPAAPVVTAEAPSAPEPAATVAEPAAPDAAAQQPTTTGALPAAPPADSRAPALAEGEADLLLQEAEARLKGGDVAVARAYFEKVFASGDPRGAAGMARTHDPEVLAGLPVIGLGGDAAQAVLWRQRAEGLKAAARE